MKTKYLIVEEVMEIHERIIERSGGYSGMLSFGNLDFILAKTRIPRKFESKAASLLFGIISHHPFLDGNKRTAFVVVKDFLFMNGFKLLVSEEDIWRILHSISKGSMSEKEVSIWIRGQPTRRR